MSRMRESEELNEKKFLTLSCALSLQCCLNSWRFIFAVAASFGRFVWPFGHSAVAV